MEWLHAICQLVVGSLDIVLEVVEVLDEHRELAILALEHQCFEVRLRVRQEPLLAGLSALAVVIGELAAVLHRQHLPSLGSTAGFLRLESRVGLVM